jgi:hypothetical protein
MSAEAPALSGAADCLSIPAPAGKLYNGTIYIISYFYQIGQMFFILKTRGHQEMIPPVMRRKNLAEFPVPGILFPLFSRPASPFAYYHSKARTLFEYFLTYTGRIENIQRAVV